MKFSLGQEKVWFLFSEAMYIFSFPKCEMVWIETIKFKVRYFAVSNFFIILFFMFDEKEIMVYKINIIFSQKNCALKKGEEEEKGLAYHGHYGTSFVCQLNVFIWESNWVILCHSVNKDLSKVHLTHWIGRNSINKIMRYPFWKNN